MRILEVVTGTVLADGAGYHHATEWGWVMMAGWWLVVIIMIAVVLRALPSSRWSGPSAVSDAEAILARRFAAGDIDADEYNDRRSALRS